MKIDPKHLYQRIPDTNFSNHNANFQLAQLLTKFMTAQKGIGLAANQVGYNKRVFVMRIQNQLKQCFNPEIISINGELIQSKEGCLSFPKDWIDVARPEVISVKYFDYRGNPYYETLTGLTARCFQHELDHLNGITMHQRHKEQNDVSPKS